MKLFISILTLLFLFGCSPQEETPVANEEVVEVTEEVKWRNKWSKKRCRCIF